MQGKTYNIIGLMSGTSLDGLDIAFCAFLKSPEGWEFELKASKHVPYGDETIEELREAIMWPAPRLLAYDYRFGNWLGNQVKRFISETQSEPDIIASHGHTIHHQPEKGFTYQIGAGQAIAERTGIKTIADFRSKDVTLGGQGAPLVPIGDQSLFRDYDFCLNLGGIANISFEQNGKRIAYDIGPANMLLNYLAGQTGLTFDEGGKLASSGSVIPELLDQLDKLDYYQLLPPKSLGFEWFTSELKPIIDLSEGSVADKMATAVKHEASQIVKAICEVEQASGKAKVLITGGGAKNDFLINEIRSQLTGRVEVIIPEESIIDFKEAIVFAYMGLLRSLNEPNCLASVTGAIKDVSGGVIFLP